MKEKDKIRMGIYNRFNVFWREFIVILLILGSKDEKHLREP